ncbi:putative T-complex protein 1 subunit theta [Cocos nucifera]|uniref:CCT-theta n=1 Tax=Cocos nucifera TaxID=13894 RepID=A0A8K0N5P6_COCNU|nr:putative T-complex protein 1 subunit theta [Cocos nucifera]
MRPYGIQAMLKEGHKHLSGLDEAVLKNIDACKELSVITRTSLGPNGMNKMVINHLDKLFVTNDAATIVNELEVQHPAAKILVLAGKAQQEEIGDGANLTISFAGELLQGAEELIRMGLHPSEIISGYTKAINKTVEILDELVEKGSETMDVKNKDEVVSRMKAAVASKQFGQEGILCPLIADACIQVCPKNPANFNVDNVRVAKLLGGGLHNCTVVRGMVLKNDAIGSIKRMEKAKIAVFAGGVDTSATETKGTVLIHNAEQLENYAKTEEAKVEELIKAVADSGAKVVVSGAAVGDMALHFCERYKLMVLKISSKFELRRFCRTTGAVALLKLSRPNPDELGYADSVSVEEIGGVRVTVVKNEEGGNSVSTVVVRGSTDSILDDLERAVDDGVNTYKAMCRDSRIVPGAAATEIELARRLKEFSFKETGLDQYAIAKFAESFEMVPRTLAENAGLNAMEIISSLYAEHAAGNTNVGIDLEEGICKDVSTMSIWDLHLTKFFALKYAADAACTVLRVDQVELASIAPENMIEVKWLVTLHQDLLGSEITINNAKSSSIQLSGSVISHLKVSTPDATYAVGLQGSNYRSKQPMMSEFSILLPDTSRKGSSNSSQSLAQKALQSLFSRQQIEDENEGFKIEESEGEEDDDYAHMTERMSRIYSNAPREFTIIDRMSVRRALITTMQTSRVQIGRLPIAVAIGKPKTPKNSRIRMAILLVISENLHSIWDGMAPNRQSGL